MKIVKNSILFILILISVTTNAIQQNVKWYNSISDAKQDDNEVSVARFNRNHKYYTFLKRGTRFSIDSLFEGVVFINDTVIVEKKEHQISNKSLRSLVTIWVCKELKKPPIKLINDKKIITSENESKLRNQVKGPLLLYFFVMIVVMLGVSYLKNLINENNVFVTYLMYISAGMILYEVFCYIIYSEQNVYSSFFQVLLGIYLFKIIGLLLFDSNLDLTRNTKDILNLYIIWIYRFILLISFIFFLLDIYDYQVSQHTYFLLLFGFSSLFFTTLIISTSRIFKLKYLFYYICGFEIIPQLVLLKLVMK